MSNFLFIALYAMPVVNVLGKRHSSTNSPPCFPDSHGNCLFCRRVNAYTPEPTPKPLKQYDALHCSSVCASLILKHADKLDPKSSFVPNLSRLTHPTGLQCHGDSQQLALP